MTTSDLEIQQRPAVMARGPMPGETGISDITARLLDWGNSFQAVYQACEGLCQTSFVPAQFKGKPMEATAAVLTGMELGLSPMAAMQAFNPIQGQAAPKALTLRAVAQSHGHRFRFVGEPTDELVIMEGRRKGETDWQRVEWPIARAAKMQLTGKDNWKKQPGTMLIARATSELARLIAADALLGIPYSYEELADMDPVEAEVVASKTTSAHGRSLRDLAEERRPAEPTPQPPVTADQLTRLAAAFKAAGITKAADGLAFLTDTLRRDITSSKELTEVEAEQVLAALRNATDADVEEPPADPWADNGEDSNR